MESFTFRFSSPLLHDRLRTLADEYSASMELLINLAANRLVDDVEFLRKLRAGEIKLE